MYSVNAVFALFLFNLLGLFTWITLTNLCYLIFGLKLDIVKGQYPDEEYDLCICVRSVKKISNESLKHKPKLPWIANFFKSIFQVKIIFIFWPNIYFHLIYKQHAVTNFYAQSGPLNSKSDGVIKDKLCSIRYHTTLSVTSKMLSLLQ